jgi:thiol-disulfide isomerase/thioredoxin
MLKTKLILVALVITFSTHGQKNLIVTPEKPKPGDVIQITYTPSGNIANTIGKVEGVVYLTGVTSRKADDILLKKSGKKYTAIIATDTATRFIHMGFHVNNKYDNNFGEGYTLQLYRDGQPVNRSSAYQAAIYQYGDGVFGIEKNLEKAIAAYEQEFAAYPENKKIYTVSYYRALNSAKKEDFQVRVQKEIEALLKAGLKDENDYMNLEGLYAVAKAPEQAKFTASVKKERFPNGKWTINDKINLFYTEKDLAKKQALLAEIENNIATNKDWKIYEQNLSGFKSTVLLTLIAEKKYDEFKKQAALLTDKQAQATAYNSAAWRMQEKNEEPKLAEEFSKMATEYVKTEWMKPTAPKPDYLTTKSWNEQRKGLYGMYADTYAMTLYRTGNYKKGFEYAKEAAITINEGNDADQNNSYALLAEKVLPADKAFTEVETFVRSGKAVDETKQVLKRLYIVNNKLEAEYDTYFAALQKEIRLKMIEELRKSMVNDAVTPFAIKDINGNKIASADWKGKVVVVDFWATWCGPCIASFPGMQMAVNKFKDNPDVKFVFIDTWEQGEEKEKKASDFIASNKYTFDVLMDNDNKVVEQFKVDGIPTKFILDKEGNIRFKAVGYNGDNDKLLEEITNMITLASGKELE